MFKTEILRNYTCNDIRIKGVTEVGGEEFKQL